MRGRGDGGKPSASLKWLREVESRRKAIPGRGNGSCKGSEMCGLECLEKEKSVWEGMPENVAPGESKQWRGDSVQDPEGWQILWGHQTWSRSLSESCWRYLIAGCLFPVNSKPSPHIHTHCTELKPPVSGSRSITEFPCHPSHRHMCTQGQGTENLHCMPHSLWKSLAYLLYNEPNVPCPCEAFGLADNVWIQIPEINYLFKLCHSWKQLARQSLLRVAVF